MENFMADDASFSELELKSIPRGGVTARTSNHSSQNHSKINLDSFLRRPAQSPVSARPAQSPLSAQRPSHSPLSTQKDRSSYKTTHYRSSARGPHEDPSIIRHLDSMLHPETQKFVQKYCPNQQCGISLKTFIEAVLQEYQQLWGEENINRVLPDFTMKVRHLFGDQIQLETLIEITETNGMIGLILDIFRSIREGEQNLTLSSNGSKATGIQLNSVEEGESLENIQNIIQEFMESIYKTMEKEIYHKFNIEIRRIILKYRQAEQLLHKTTQLINHNIDIVELKKTMRSSQKLSNGKIQQLKEENEALKKSLQQEQATSSKFSEESQKTKADLKRLGEKLHKYEDAVLQQITHKQPAHKDNLTHNHHDNRKHNQQNLKHNQQNFKHNQQNLSHNGHYNQRHSSPLSMKAEPFSVHIETKHYPVHQSPLPSSNMVPTPQRSQVHPPAGTVKFSRPVSPINHNPVSPINHNSQVRYMSGFSPAPITTSRIVTYSPYKGDHKK